MTDFIRVDVSGGVARITLTDEKTRNSLSEGMMNGLLQRLKRAKAILM